MSQGKSGFVAIVGRPNAGKSTLMNTILGSEISIVSPKAQTTRDRIHGILTEQRGQMVFTDTPGLHRAKEGGLNQALISEAVEALEGGQVIWYLLDPQSSTEHEKVALELIRPFRGTPVYLVINKLDLNRTPPRRQAVEEFQAKLAEKASEYGIEFQKTFFISAQDGKNVSELLKATWDALPTGPAYYPDKDQLSDRPLRFFVGEKIRQQLFRQLGDELPYSCAVQIESFNEKSKPLRIEALIFVERDSQQGMVVGKGGTKIKSIGQAAREEIEKFLDQKVFLGLRVKVLKNWTREAEALKKLGYILPQSQKQSQKKSQQRK